MNLCPTCGEDFAGLEVFDRHRVRQHAEASAENRPSCLTIEEMLALGWAQNSRGHWSNPARAVRGHYAKDPKRRRALLGEAARK